MLSIVKTIWMVIIMIFKKDSAIVRSYVLLILAGEMIYEEVPNLFNLREAVAELLGLEI